MTVHLRFKNHKLNYRDSSDAPETLSEEIDKCTQQEEKSAFSECVKTATDKYKETIVAFAFPESK